MSDSLPNSLSGEWPLYANPELLRVAVELVKDGWASISLRCDPDDTVGVALCSENDRLKQDEILDEDGCSESAESDENPMELARVLLKLRIEEIPRLVAILNEIYLALYGESSAAIYLDTTGSWGSRRAKVGRLSLTFPLGSRTEPESSNEDLADRIAVLRAYQIVGERLHADADKLGLLRPIA